MKPTRLLLINPHTPPSFWGLEYSLPFSSFQASNAPLNLITVAALCPEHWEISLIDENVDELDLDFACDVVGIGAMNNQMARAFELADHFRQRGCTVVLGGPLTFSNAELCTPHCDVLVMGEAERTWPKFCRDFDEGAFAPQYIETGAVDMALSPVPRFDLLRGGAYASIPIQTGRGCPHSCEFCDIIVMFGRRVRNKPVANVLAEIEAVRQNGAHDSIFFTDDNFNSNLKYSRALLQGIIELREHTGYKPVLFSQASVDLADRDELLNLMIHAGFSRLFLGVETPRQSSLREANKRQNLHGNLLERIHKLQHAGLITWAGMIVGFDHDDPDIFEEQAEFLDQAGIAMAMVGMLNAMPRTPLYERLQREGRLILNADRGNNCSWTNIVPLKMTRPEMFRGFAELLQHLYTQENYARRLMGNIYRMGPPEPGVIATRLPSMKDLADLSRAVFGFTLHRDARYRRHFVPNLLKCMFQRFPRVVEACVHLGIWQHFDIYVPQLVAEIEAAAAHEESLAQAQPVTRRSARAAASAGSQAVQPSA